jgi:peptidoglycan/LPS O-acetylase OafA/YrhL
MHAPVAASESSSFVGTKYRPDIDGLRAVAVLSVVAFHAFPNSLRSGFVGVDIFLVISGFLITSIILNGVTKGQFSFVTFYARRIKRIFPALIVVLIACLLAGWFLLFADEYRYLGKHTAAGAGFVSNFALWQESNYFDVAANRKILLHLWSLGIEEQFYLIWPALIWVAWRLRLNSFILFATVFTASVIYSIEETPLDPIAAFYSPAARFWELAAGSLLAHITFFAPRPATWIEHTVATIVSAVLFQRGDIDKDKVYRDFLSTTGMALIFSSVFIITRRNEFPGWWALMPVAGAYLTIAAGPAAWLNRLLLSNQIMVWFGTISYPLYLWHWPLLAFARNFYGRTPPASLHAALVLIAIVLAWLTYRYVEKSVRFGYRQVWIAPALTVAMLVIGALGAVDFSYNGFSGRLNEDRASYAAYFDPASQLMRDEVRVFGAFECSFYSWDATVPTLAPRKAIDPSCYTRHSNKSLLIIGDSNGADLYHGLKEVLPNDISVLLIYSSNCRVKPVIERLVATNHCHMANYFALNRIKSDPPDVLLLSSNFSFDIGYIREFAAMVRSYGVKHVLVLGQRPHWRSSLYKIVLENFWLSTPRYVVRDFLDDELMAYTEKFQSQLQPDEPFEFVDEMQPFCNSEGCLAYLGDNRREGLITSDTVHLRPFASVWLAHEQLAPLILKEFETPSDLRAPPYAGTPPGNKG